MYGLKYDDNPDVSSCMSFHAEVIRLAHRFEVLELQKLAFENIKKMLKAAWDADEFVPVLDTVVPLSWKGCILISCEHIDELLTEPRFLSILRRNPYLAKELIKATRNLLRSYSCPQCRKTWSLDCSLLSSPSFCPGCGHHEQDWGKFMK